MRVWCVLTALLFAADAQAAITAARDLPAGTVIGPSDLAWIEEVPGGLCWCGKKATMNTRVDQKGRVIKEGEQVLIDNHTAIRYIGLCYEHWRKGISHGG